MTTSKLTDKTVKNAKPKEVNGVLKDNYLPDGGGLYFIVTAKGGKLWRYHFSFPGLKHIGFTFRAIIPNYFPFKGRLRKVTLKEGSKPKRQRGLYSN